MSARISMYTVVLRQSRQWYSAVSLSVCVLSLLDTLALFLQGQGRGGAPHATGTGGIQPTEPHYRQQYVMWTDNRMLRAPGDQQLCIECVTGRCENMYSSILFSHEWRWDVYHVELERLVELQACANLWYYCIIKPPSYATIIVIYFLYFMQK